MCVCVADWLTVATGAPFNTDRKQPGRPRIRRAPNMKRRSSIGLSLRMESVDVITESQNIHEVIDLVNKIDVVRREALEPDLEQAIAVYHTRCLEHRVPECTAGVCHSRLTVSRAPGD